MRTSSFQYLLLYLLLLKILRCPLLSQMTSEQLWLLTAAWGSIPFQDPKFSCLTVNLLNGHLHHLKQQVWSVCSHKYTSILLYVYLLLNTLKDEGYIIGIHSMQLPQTCIKSCNVTYLVGGKHPFTSKPGKWWLDSDVIMIINCKIKVM